MIKSSYFKEHPILSTVLSAGSSRFITSIVISPFEAKRIRLGAQTDTKTSLSIKQHLSSIKLTAQRDVLYSMICWAIIESLRNKMAGEGEYRAKQKSSSDILKLNTLTGLVGATVASIITNPIDVVKTRLQSKSLSTKSTWKDIRRIARLEGIKGLSLGVQLRILKSSLHLSVYLTLYEELLNVIKRNTQSH